jgi:cellulose synthase/poly-beta-1,6-N-acetylglucosamine synthase-like glycosyltransferase
MDHFFSIVSPIRNEEQYIAKCLSSIVDQNYEKNKYEIIIVDGMSDDATRKIVKRFETKYDNIKLLDNPHKTVPYALNLGIKQASGNVIVRVDGHAVLEKDYLNKCHKYLVQTKADCVGGAIESINDTFIGKAIALAMSSQFGVGNARFRTSGKEGLVDCLAFGAYRREIFNKIGCFNEEFVRCQDDEFNYRLRKLGGKIYFSPEIKSYYYPRSDLRKLWRQYYQYGFWKVRVLQKHFKTIQPRQFVPPIFVMALISTGLLGIFSKMSLAIFLFITSLYLIFSLSVSLKISFKNGHKFFYILPVIFSILHVSYGSGFLAGIFGFFKYWMHGREVESSFRRVNNNRRIKMKRCSTCIMPASDPSITFDGKGECNYCQEYKRIQYLGAEKLEEDLAMYKTQSGKYDCLVPISGGKDSTFVLYQMNKIFGLKVLAFNYDNCLTHPQAQENVREVANLLGVDLVIKKNEKQKNHLITNLKAYLRKPSLGMVPMLCTGCRYGIIGNAFKEAKKHNIPMIIIGWSPIEDTPFKEAYLRDSSKSVMGGLMRNIIKNPAYIKPGNMIAAVKDYYHNYQHVKDWNIILKMLHPGVNLLQFYDYIPYNPDKIQRTLEEKVGWKTPNKKDSWQWDCKIKLLQNYFYDNYANFTATDGYLSAMVREGFISREEALDRLVYLKQNKNGKLSQLHAFLNDLDQQHLVPNFQ